MKAFLHSQTPKAVAAFFFILFALSVAACGQASETILHNFVGDPFPGDAAPNTPLARDAAGNLYGVAAGEVFELSRTVDGNWQKTSLHSFSFFSNPSNGYDPNGVIVDAAGNLYGTTVYGGDMPACSDGFSDTGCGAVYKLSPDSTGVWKETMIFKFPGGSGGALPAASVVMDAAGNLYGTTEGGGQYSCSGVYCGIVYELSPGANGKWNETVLYSFTGGPDGADPTANLIIDQAGNLYGTTLSGGNNSDCLFPTPGCGVVFELSPSSAGWTEKVLYTFTGQDDGGNPLSGVVRDTKGNLYGEAQYGVLQGGVVFELSPNSASGWSETVLTSFSLAEDDPRGGLTMDATGNLYGTLSAQATTAYGQVFELSPATSGGWNYSVLHTFTDVADGGQPYGGVILDAAGNLYGTTFEGGGNGCGSAGWAFGCGVVFELSSGANGWQESVLYDFVSGGQAQPQSGLVMDASGNLYGTTSAGGAHAWGTIYEMSPVAGGWHGKTLYSFTGGADGGYPVGGLAFDPAGNLYGTAQNGGSANCPRGCGSVFKLTAVGNGTWRFGLLHDFQGTKDGEFPQTSLVLDAAGNIYGTTQAGGGACPYYDCGTVFEVSPVAAGWSETVLHRFTFGSDGGDPEGGLLLSNGNLYGTTALGGTRTGNICESVGCGVVFELALDTDTYSVIHTFAGNNLDGNGPQGSLIADGAGNLYGAARSGPNAASGMAFELTPSSGGNWPESVLTTGFGSRQTSYLSELVFDSHGNLFGSQSSPIYSGGVGTIFELIPKSGGWSQRTYFTFPSPQQPGGNLLLDASGDIYGTSQYGGSNGFGVFYEIVP